MNNAALLQRLAAWRAEGWLRALDVALADFVHTLAPQAPASLLLASAWLAQLEGQGHSCLPLTDFAESAASVLGWPAEADAELATVLHLLPASAEAARAAWSGLDVLEVDPAADGGSSPLVLSGDRLYLRRYWRHERQVAAQLRARTADAAAPLSTTEQQQARALLDRLFGPADTNRPDWQKLACAIALRGRFTLITGGPGTGKTYTAARLLVLLQALHGEREPPLRVALAAPTGKAASRLRQSIDAALQALQLPELPLARWQAQIGPARTLHALLGARPDTRHFVHDAGNPLALDLLFVDEASMVHLEMMDTLLAALPPQARVVLLGDRDQLASVEAGAVMGDLCEGLPPNGAPQYAPDTVQWLHALTGIVLPAAPDASPRGLTQQTVTLRESRRFAGPIGQLAHAVNQGDVATATRWLAAGDDAAVRLHDTGDAHTVAGFAVAGRSDAPAYRPFADSLRRRPAQAAAFDDWAVDVLQRFDGFRVLCALRAGPWGVDELNIGIERALVAQGLLTKRGEWYEGRPVMVTRNDRALGVFNGDVGVVLKAPGDGGALRAYFLDGSVLRSVAVGRLADVETAFAMTVHKSQGSEFGHVALVLPEQDNPVLTRELLYTGITRARQAFTLCARGALPLQWATRRRTRRLSGLGTLASQGGEH